MRIGVYSFMKMFLSNGKICIRLNNLCDFFAFVRNSFDALPP